MIPVSFMEGEIEVADRVKVSEQLTLGCGACPGLCRWIQCTISRVGKDGGRKQEVRTPGVQPSETKVRPLTYRTIRQQTCTGLSP